MKDFLLYSLFSMFEYVSVYFLLFSLFTIDIRSHMKEIFIIALNCMIVSYIIVITKGYLYIPISIIVIIMSTLFLFYFIKAGKKIYCLIISIGGFVTYGIIQALVSLVAVTTGAINHQAMNAPFTGDVYTMQIISASIAFLITAQILKMKSGFGFFLRNGNYVRFALSLIFITIVLSASSITLYYSSSSENIINVSLVFFIGTVISMGLFYQRDHYEYSVKEVTNNEKSDL